MQGYACYNGTANNIQWELDEMNSVEWPPLTVSDFQGRITFDSNLNKKSNPTK